MKCKHLLFFLFLATTTVLFPAAEPATIHEAAKQGNLAAVKRLLDQDPSLVNHRDSDGNTPLHWAACHGRTIIALPMPDRKALEQLNRVVNYRDYLKEPSGNPSNPRWEETNRQYNEIIHLLIKHGAIVNQQNKAGATPLHSAACIGNEGAGRLLLENGALINQKDNFGDTPLHKAACRRNFKFVHFLLERGASIIKNNADKTPIDSAIKRGYDSVANLIQDYLQHRCYVARLAFYFVLNPRTGANSPANVFPQNVVQEIVWNLQPSDFATTMQPR